MLARASSALESLARHLRHGDVIPEGDRDLLLDALDGYLDGAVPLDRALGLKPAPGQRSAQTVGNIAKRDDLLRAAAVKFWPNERPTKQARFLHRRWMRYARASWLRERTLSTPPAGHVGTVEADLWAVMRAKDHLLSERAVRGILAASSGVFVAKITAHHPNHGS